MEEDQGERPSLPQRKPDKMGFFGNGDMPLASGYQMDARGACGPFTRMFSSARMAQIVDGTAYTIAMGEVLPACREDGANLDWFHWNSGWTSTAAPINWNTCPGEQGNNAKGTGNADPCRDLNAYNASMGFKSRHKGGALFVMCDGNVRFLSEEIDYFTYQRLGSMNEGRPIWTCGGK